MSQLIESTPLPTISPAPSTSAREGSPWTGVWAVVTKEMADHLTSARMRILELLILLTAGGTVLVAVQTLRQNASQSDFAFLQLFTTSQGAIPAFVGFLAFLVPLIAIALAFDAVNGEFNQRTLSRILAQPIYRDALLLGKFLAGLFTIALVLTSIWLMIMGLGLVGLGVPPTSEEVARSLLFLLVTVFYGGVWLALALMFSTIFRQPATAALAALAIWLFFTIFWSMITNLITQAMIPDQVTSLEQIAGLAEFDQTLNRVSPNTLYVEATTGLLFPDTRSFGIVLPSEMEGAILGAPLPLGQSALLIWPHLTGLIAITVLLFAIAYVFFQRQEIRA